MNDDELLKLELEKQLKLDLAKEDLQLKKLYITQKWEKIETDPVRQYISDLYNQKNKRKQPNRKLAFKATLFDACVTQQLTEFLLSYEKIFVPLLSQNKNVVTKTCNGSEYSAFVAQMISEGIIKEKRKHEWEDFKVTVDEALSGNIKKGRWKAGLYELTYKPIVNYINKLNEEYLVSIIGKEVNGTNVLEMELYK